MRQNYMKKMMKKNEAIAAILCIVMVLILTIRSNVFWDPRNLHSLQASFVPTAII